MQNSKQNNFLKLGAVDTITAYCIDGPELMKLIFTVLYVSRTYALL